MTAARSTASGQRVRKRQPDGRSPRFGGSPSSQDVAFRERPARNRRRGCAANREERFRRRQRGIVAALQDGVAGIAEQAGAFYRSGSGRRGEG